LKEGIANVWKKLHPDSAPATMWDDIATDYIQRWKEKKRIGSMSEMTASVYYQTLCSEMRNKH
jgi:hypothetical protein